jgi:hypothetical protein
MKFKKGKSGNPKGRPKGLPDKRTALRALLEPHAEELIRVAVERALEGDTAALRLCLERLIPPVRSTDEAVSIELKGTMTERGQAIIDAMSAGQITPSQTAEMLAGLATQARLIEASDLEKRIAALEQAASTKPNGGRT